MSLSRSVDVLKHVDDVLVHVADVLKQVNDVLVHVIDVLKQVGRLLVAVVLDPKHKVGPAVCKLGRHLLACRHELG